MSFMNISNHVDMGLMGQETPKRRLIKDDVHLHAACYDNTLSLSSLFLCAQVKRHIVLLHPVMLIYLHNVGFMNSMIKVGH